jgi:hypothetical protein
MTVGQLIEILGKYDKDLHVTLLVVSYDGYYSSEESCADCIDPENVFLNNNEGLTIKAVEVL